MDKLHRELLLALKKEAGNGTEHSKNDSYLLSGHTYYDISVPLRRRIAKEWVKDHRDIASKDFRNLLDSLFEAPSHEEKTLACMLLGYCSLLRKNVSLQYLNRWLDELVGWAEIDALCFNIFTAEELLSDWGKWEQFIRKLSKDKNINKRRAALVFLAGPVHRSPDIRIKELSFEMVDVLKGEKPILITKAISWILREMVLLHKEEVSAYLRKHENTLPKIALRETRRKILTGRK